MMANALDYGRKHRKTRPPSLIFSIHAEMCKNKTPSEIGFYYDMKDNLLILWNGRRMRILISTETNWFQKKERSKGENIMKKAWLRLGAAALALTMLTACGGTGGSSNDDNASSGDNTEAFKLRISTTGESDDGLDIAMRMFKEKYPNVEYEIITSPLDELRNKQLMLLSMDDIPDIGKMKDWNKEFYKDDLVIDM